MKKTFKKLFVGALVAISAFTIGMNSKTFAADDDLYADQAAKEYQVTSGYEYAGFASLGGSAKDYNYLVISYKGSEGAFLSFRFETTNVDENAKETNKTGAFWVKDMLTVDGKSLPKATDEVQTAIVKLDTLNGINMDFNSLHLHQGDMPGCEGKFEITELKFTKELPSAEDAKPADKPEETTEAAGDDTPSTDSGEQSDAEYLYADAAAKEYTVSAGYEYAGFASLGGNAQGYDYLVISYKGSAGAFLSFRFETVNVDENGKESNKTGAFWIKDMMTVEGKSIPKATDEIQTAVIKLSDLNGINMDFNSLHLHQGDMPDCPGKFEIVEFKLSKKIPDPSELVFEEETEEATDAPASGDKPAASTPDSSTDNSDDSSSTDMTPIFIVLGGVFVAVVAFVASKKIVK